MATLSVWNHFTLPSQGVEKTGKHGTITDAVQTPFDITVTGTCHQATGTIADDEIATIWDEDDDAPAGFDFCHIWTDQDCYLQVIGAATSFVVSITAKVPFVLSSDSILAAASTTPMTAGVAPSVEDIDSLVLSNMSGSTMNYVASFVD